MIPEKSNEETDGGFPPRAGSPSLLTDAELETLNPGIRNTVQTLRKWGFDTRDSGDGSTAQYECDLPHPYVHILTSPATMASETDRLIGLLESEDINFRDCPHPQEDPEGAAKHPSVEASYLPLQGGFAAIHLMNVILPLGAGCPTVEEALGLPAWSFREFLSENVQAHGSRL